MRNATVLALVGLMSLVVASPATAQDEPPPSPEIDPLGQSLIDMVNREWDAIEDQTVPPVGFVVQRNVAPTDLGMQSGIVGEPYDAFAWWVEWGNRDGTGAVWIPTPLWCQRVGWHMIQADRWSAGMPDEPTAMPTNAAVTGCIRALDPLPGQAGVALPFTWYGQVDSRWYSEWNDEAMTPEEAQNQQALQASADAFDKNVAYLREVEEQLKQSQAQVEKLKKQLRRRQ